MATAVSAVCGAFDAAFAKLLWPLVYYCKCKCFEQNTIAAFTKVNNVKIHYDKFCCHKNWALSMELPGLSLE